MTSCLARSAPLHQIPTHLNVQVPLYLTAPIVESSPAKKRSFWIEFFSLLFNLELCYFKLHASQSQQQPPSTSTLSTTEQSNFLIHTIVNDLQHQIQTLLRRSSSLIEKSYDLSQCLHHYQLHTLFPFTSTGLPPPVNSNPSSMSLNDQMYLKDLDFKSLASLNQVVALALQLRQDMELTNHKYIAHQLALLYQSLGQAREDLKSFKPEIETQFEIIKAVCSATDTDPRLSPEQRDWIRQLTTQILSQALFQKKPLSPYEPFSLLLQTV